MTEFSYIPIIKTGDAELKALQNLDTRYKVKFTPVIELTRGRRSKKDVVGILQKRIDKLKEINLHRFFIDLTSDSSLSSIEIDIKRSNKDNYKGWCDFCLSLKQFFPLICPVIQIEEDIDYESYLTGLANQIIFMQQHFDYLMFRIDSDNFINIVSDLKKLQETYANIDISKIFCMLDNKYIRHDNIPTALIIKCCEVLASINIKNIVISSTSYPNSITEMLGTLPDGKIKEDTLPLYELKLYNRVKNDTKDINLIYSDYASVNPIRNDNIIMAKGWIPRIDLPYFEDMIIYREKRGTSSYATRYKEIAASVYNSEEFSFVKKYYNCWGVEEIEKAAAGAISGANITFWISVRVNIYLTMKLVNIT